MLKKWIIVLVIAALFVFGGGVLLGYLMDANRQVNPADNLQADKSEQGDDLVSLAERGEWELADLSENLRNARAEAMPDVSEENKMPLFNEAEFNGDYWLLWWDSGSGGQLGHGENNPDSKSPLYQYPTRGDLVQYTPGRGFVDLSKYFYDNNLHIHDIQRSGDWWLIKTKSSDGLLEFYFFDGTHIEKYDDFPAVLDKDGFEHIFSEPINDRGLFIAEHDDRYFVFDKNYVREVSGTFSNVLDDEHYFSAKTFRVDSTDTVAIPVNTSPTSLSNSNRVAFFDGKNLNIREFDFIDYESGEVIKSPRSAYEDLLFTPYSACVETLCYYLGWGERDTRVSEVDYDAMRIRQFPREYFYEQILRVEVSDSFSSRVNIDANGEVFLFIISDIEVEILDEVAGTRTASFDTRLVTYNPVADEVEEIFVYNPPSTANEASFVMIVTWDKALAGWVVRLGALSEDEEIYGLQLGVLTESGNLVEGTIDDSIFGELEMNVVGLSAGSYLIFGHPNRYADGYFYVPTDEFSVYELNVRQ